MKKLLTSLTLSLSLAASQAHAGMIGTPAGSSEREQVKSSSRGPSSPSS